MRKNKVRKYPVKAQAFLQKLLGPLIRWMFRVKVEGSEKLPADGRLIVCSNHVSYLDPVVLAVTFNRPINFIGKESLFRVFGLHALLVMLGVIPINREAPGREVFRATTQILLGEGVVGIYPEGTRSKTGEMIDGKAGVGMLVVRGEAPVLPCAVKYPKKAGLFRPTKIIFGDMIPVSQLITGTGKACYHACAETIMSHIGKLSEQL